MLESMFSTFYLLILCGLAYKPWEKETVKRELFCQLKLMFTGRTMEGNYIPPIYAGASFLLAKRCLIRLQDCILIALFITWHQSTLQIYMYINQPVTCTILYHPKMGYCGVAHPAPTSCTCAVPSLLNFRPGSRRPSPDLSLSLSLCCLPQRYTEYAGCFRFSKRMFAWVYLLLPF